MHPYCNYEEPLDCLNKIINKNIAYWIIYSFISSICLVFVVFMCLFYKWNKIYGIISIVMAVYLIFFHYGEKSVDYKTIDFSSY